MTGVSEGAECVVVTRGPSGADSHEEAVRSFGVRVRLAEPFRGVMATADDGDVLALSPSGYSSAGDGSVLDCWADLHVSAFVDLLRCWHQPRRPVALALAPDVGELADVVNASPHQAARAFARSYSPAAQMRWANSKLEAVSLAAAAYAGARLDSFNVVKSGPRLRVYRQFSPAMISCRYGVRKLARAYASSCFPLAKDRELHLSGVPATIDLLGRIG